MTFEQTKILSSNNSKYAQLTMNKLSQVSVINFKHEKVRKSSIPNVPDNYTCSKRQKPGKSFIPRFMIKSKQAENGKLSLSRVNSIDNYNLEKAKPSISLNNYCKPVKNISYIPRKTPKKVVCTQESQLKIVKAKPTYPSHGKSKIPVPVSIKKMEVSAPVSSKKMTRTTSHSRTCSVCSLKSLSTVKKGNARVSNRDDRTHVLNFNSIKKDYVSSYISSPTSPTSPTSIKKSLIPVNNLFKKRVSPMLPSINTSVNTPVNTSTITSTITTSTLTTSTLTIVKGDELDELVPIFTSNKETHNIMHTSLRSKRTSLTSINKPEASISIYYDKVEVTTTTSIIKPDLSSISLLHKAEKDLSMKHQAEKNEDAPFLFGNVFKTIARFSKDLFSKLVK